MATFSVIKLLLTYELIKVGKQRSVKCIKQENDVWDIDNLLYKSSSWFIILFIPDLALAS